MSSAEAEDLVLEVSSVKIKQGGLGRLIITSAALEWKSSANDSSAHRYELTKIKGQKVSPESKDKVQLQVVMVDASTATFQFLNPDGKTSQLRDRDAVKESLVQMLSAVSRPLPSDGMMERKQKILAENAQHFRLYKDLVPTGIMSADHFWKHIAGTVAGSQKDDQLNVAQGVGIPSGFLVNLTSADGCNGTKLNLTADTLDAIFRAYPSVAKKHAEVVPQQMTEQSFWAEFFQSHYFHRDRQAIPTELFGDIGASEITGVTAGKHLIHDLRNVLDEPVDAEGYGGKHIEADLHIAAVGDKSGSDASLKKVPRALLVKRFNEHSSRVLSATAGSSSAQTVTPPIAVNKSSLLDEDLVGAKSHSPAVLHIDYATSHLETVTAPLLKRRKLNSTASHHPVRTDPDALYSAMVRLLGDKHSTSACGDVPTTVAETVRHLELSLLELLRHFWSSFPATTPELEEKAERMMAALKKFEAQRFTPFLAQDEKGLVVEHIRAMLKAAYNKYDSWSVVRRKQMAK